MKRASSWLGLLFVAVVGCGGGGSSTSSTMSNLDCSSAVPKFADVTIFKKCTKCHSSSVSGAARMAAPPNINFDTYAAASSQAMEAAGLVMVGQMPPPTSGVTVTDAEKQTLYKWAMCGAQQ